MAENKLETRTVNEINVPENRFFIPEYQRGYRWTSVQVKALLNDILSHADQRPAPEKNYCLQPIVVAPREDGAWEVIDGQQRLTTIYVILRYIRPERTQFSIELATRKDSQSFLDELSSVDPDQENDVDCWHIASAWKIVEAWFEEKEKREKRQTLVDEFAIALGKNTEFIWYEVHEDVSHIEIFTRLNIGKIPLTNAELTKALLLTAVNQISDGKNGASVAALQVFQIDSKARIDAKQNEIAMQWDAIEQLLHDQRFWLFLNSKEVYEPNRIDFLFRFHYELENQRPPRELEVFHYFEEQVGSGVEAAERSEDLWTKMREHVMRLQEWFDNRELFHLTGYLISTGDSLVALYKEAQNKRKSDFVRYLKERIVHDVKQSLSQRSIFDLTYNENPDKKIIEKLLLLFNVVVALNSRDSDERFSFMQYKKQRWSLEHIHAQNSDDLSTEQERRRWLEDHQQIIEQMSKKKQLDTSITSEIKDLSDMVAALLKKKSVKEGFDIAKDEIFRVLSDPNNRDSLDGHETGEVHGIDNLALLDRETNSHLKNAVFAVKRSRIIKRDREGHFLLPATRNVFLKYYSDVVDHLYWWTDIDREAYSRELIETLHAYFEDDFLRGDE